MVNALSLDYRHGCSSLPGIESAFCWLLLASDAFRIVLYPEEQVPNLVDDFGVAARLTTWETLICGKHKVRGTLEVEKRFHAIEVIGWFSGVDAVFDGDTPLAAPFAVDLDTELSIYPRGRFLVHSVLHQDEHVRHKYARRALVELTIFVTQTPLHVPGVNAIVHDLESW